MRDHPISVASFRSTGPQQYCSSGVYATVTTMRLPCCDGGFDAGRFGGGRDAEKSSRRGVALLCAGGEVVFLLCFLERNGGGFCLVGLLSREAGVLRHNKQ